MRILFLAQIIPYPPDAGPKVKTWHVLRYLVDRGHQVTLAAFIRSDEQKNLPALQRLCYAVHTVPIQRSRKADLAYLLKSFFTRQPFLVERDHLYAMRTLVVNLVKDQNYDVIHADQLTMVQFALEAQNPTTQKPKIIFDAHNATWTILDRMINNAPPYLKPVLKIEAQRIKKYEGKLLERVDRVLTVTEIDKQALLKGFRGDLEEVESRITVIPIAVDTQQIQPIERMPGSKMIFTLGTLHYPPNADGIRWFLQQVFPLVRLREPEAKLIIVGKNPPPDFIELAARQPGVVEVTGYVPELRPYLEKSAVVVVPVRAGGGMRVRILEAFAYGMPVVTTTVGLEGIEAEPEKEVLVADSPQVFAEKVLSILEDRKLQDRLAANGRSLVERRYDWQVILTAMDKVYEALVN